MFNFLRRADIAVDLGTSKIAVFVRGEGLVLEEPACIAFKGRPSSPGAVVAVGHEAAKMCGKTPQGTFVVKPIQEGVISDCQVAGLLLKTLLAKHGLDKGLSRRRFLVGALYGASSMERHSFEQVALSAGAKDVLLVAEPLAAAVGASLPIDEPRANMVVDIGGGATEAIVVSLKSVVRGGSVRIGGDTMNHAIMHALHRHVGLDVGLQEARRLKEAVAGPIDLDSRLETRGLDVRQRCPRLASVRAGDLCSALTAPLTAITDMVKSVVNGLPAELAGDLTELGITLTGGGSASVALQRKLEEATQVAIKPLQAPQRAVINGCGLMLDYVDYIA